MSMKIVAWLTGAGTSAARVEMVDRMPGSHIEPSTALVTMDDAHDAIYACAAAVRDDVAAEIERLLAENATFRNAQRACEHCDPAGHAAAVAEERERWLKAATAALEVIDDLPAWSNGAHACQLLRECVGPNVGNNRPP